MFQINSLFNLHEGEAKHEKVKEDVVSNISFRGANLWSLACAILIASIGLNVNSTAVIIGAMLISPLMGPIVGIGFSLATYDLMVLQKAIKNLLIATGVSLLVSCLYFYLSPFKEVQSELLARTEPTIYDVLIAFFGGIVGVVSITRVEKGNPIPGVAIATALMPPLCTAGFGLATLNLKFFAGALYLYTINCFFIAISTFIVLKYMNYKPVVTENTAFDKKLRIIITFFILLTILPSSYLAYNLLQEKKYAQNIENFLKKEFYNEGFTLVHKKINYNTSPKTIELAFLYEKFDSIKIAQMNKDLVDFGIENTQLIIKQNNMDLKKEILSELNQQNSNLSQKDMQINALNTEIASYKIGNTKIVQEVKILFPEIIEISFGRLNYYDNDKKQLPTIVVLYKSNNKFDEEKFHLWMKTQLEYNNIKFLKE